MLICFSAPPGEETWTVGFLRQDAFLNLPQPENEPQPREGEAWGHFKASGAVEIGFRGPWVPGKRGSGALDLPEKQRLVLGSHGPSKKKNDFWTLRGPGPEPGLPELRLSGA